MARGKRVNVKTVLADPDLHRELMVDTIRATQAREGIETTEEQAERAYYIVTEGEKTAFLDLERFRGGRMSQTGDTICSCKALSGSARADTFQCPDEISVHIEACLWRFAALASWHMSFVDCGPRTDLGVARQGKCTSRMIRWLRQSWEMCLIHG